MKIFTVEEANEMLPDLEDKLLKLQRLYSQVGDVRDSARAAASASKQGGGMQGGADYVRLLYEIGRITTALHKIGVQLEDYERGLIDFPAMRSGELVLLCWQLGDGPEIGWWHHRKAGFAGRRPI